MDLKTSLIVCGALLASAPAHADWAFVTESSGGEKFFIETTSIRKIASQRQAWILREFPRPDEEGSRSAKVLMEFDCGRDQYRLGNELLYEDSMGKGKRGSTTYRVGYWTLAVPDTPIWAVLRRVC